MKEFVKEQLVIIPPTSRVPATPAAPTPPVAQLAIAPATTNDPGALLAALLWQYKDVIICHYTLVTWSAQPNPPMYPSSVGWINKIMMQGLAELTVSELICQQSVRAGFSGLVGIFEILSAQKDCTFKRYFISFGVRVFSFLIFFAFPVSLDCLRCTW